MADDRARISDRRYRKIGNQIGTSGTAATGLPARYGHEPAPGLGEV